jgi:1,4-alpha-glucan branching enzyme
MSGWSQRIVGAAAASRHSPARPKGVAATLQGVFPAAQDLYLFNEGSHTRLYQFLGAHPVPGARATRFAVWAPNAAEVSVVGDFNAWQSGLSPLSPQGVSGIWAGTLGDVGVGALYKYHIVSRYSGYEADKADPVAFAAERPPRTASVVADTTYAWGDLSWMAGRGARQSVGAPVSVYEVHLGSWRRRPEERDRPLSYREVAPRLADYVRAHGFTHVELLPLTEHPFYGSWGYQSTGYFAPTARYGSPADLKYLIDHLHQAGIAVWLDWVPSHFPADAHGLAFFDGTHLYEHQDPRLGVHPDWGSLIFNYGRREVQSFLLSSALYWLDEYHADGLRVDAVASMLYRDYSRRPGEWLPNVAGGRENLEAVSFLRRLNEVVYASCPGVQTVAEESTAWPLVSRPTSIGGLGFGYKWDMGWMHDTLRYMARDPVHRRHHHNDITFRSVYVASENFVLPLSHDEVVHGKGSLLGRMPGDRWQRLAGLRLLLAMMWAQPGKKLLFMGGEFAQEREWDHERSLDWHLLERPEHAGVARLVKDLNALYRQEEALFAGDARADGIAWVVGDDQRQSVFAFRRRRSAADPGVLCVMNCTPVVRRAYRVGVPVPGVWRELLNSDSGAYGGSDVGNLGRIATEPIPAHGEAQSLSLTLPPLAALFLAPAP